MRNPRWTRPVDTQCRGGDDAGGETEGSDRCGAEAAGGRSAASAAGQKFPGTCRQWRGRSRRIGYGGCGLRRRRPLVRLAVAFKSAERLRQRMLALMRRNRMARKKPVTSDSGERRSEERRVG